MLCVRLSLCLIFAAAGAPAQSTTGQILGTSFDALRAPVAAVEIVITNEANGLTRRTQTSAEGFYVVPNLEPGRYRVEGGKAGSKKFIRSGLTLTAGERVEANLPLALGDFSERIDVRDTGATIETASGAVSQLVEVAQLRDIALNGRNIVQLLMVMPGVVSTGDEFDRGGAAFGTSAASTSMACVPPPCRPRSMAEAIRTRAISLP